jgi:hypothetical protein
MSFDETFSQSEDQRSNVNERSSRSEVRCHVSTIHRSTLTRHARHSLLLFNALDDFFTDSGLLLPNSTALVKTLLIGQLPSKKLRVAYPAHLLRTPAS